MDKSAHFVKFPQATNPLSFRPDQGEDVLEMLFEWILDNPNAFQRPDFAESKSAKHYGYIDQRGFAYIIKREFDKVMKAHGVQPDWFLNWAKEQGYINPQPGRTTMTKRLPWLKPQIQRCVLMSLEPRAEYLPEKPCTNLPF